MASTATIHPSPKVSTATLPVNAPSVEDAVRAVTETLASTGRHVQSHSVAFEAEVRAFGDVAISFPGSTKCFGIRVEYVKAGAR